MASIGNLSAEIANHLRQYTTEVQEGLEEAKKTVTKDAVKRLKTTSPKGKSGMYAKGWRTKKVKGAIVIHNATRYQLTHLLEHGHAKQNGGRVAGRAHIRPAEQQAIADFEREVERVIRG